MKLNQTETIILETIKLTGRYSAFEVSKRECNAIKSLAKKGLVKVSIETWDSFKIMVAVNQAVSS